MRVVLARRHHGQHAFVKEARVPGPFSRYVRHLHDPDAVRGQLPVVDEARLLAKLPRDFLPAPPKEVLLMADDQDGGGCTAVGEPKIFRRWGKYFDVYSLTCTNKNMAFETWKKRASAFAEKHLGTGDLFDESDPYDVKGNDLDPREAFERGEKPQAYVRRVFEEDFASMANDRELARGR